MFSCERKALDSKFLTSKHYQYLQYPLLANFLTPRSTESGAEKNRFALHRSFHRLGCSCRSDGNTWKSRAPGGDSLA